MKVRVTVPARDDPQLQKGFGPVFGPPSVAELELSRTPKLATHCFKNLPNGLVMVRPCAQKCRETSRAPCKMRMIATSPASTA